jgi:hypothetical protein
MCNNLHLFFFFFSISFLLLCFRRGLPYWLREVPDIVFRTNNEPFKVTNPIHYT